MTRRARNTELGLALLLVACRMDVSQPADGPSPPWDPSLNTHPRGAAFQAVLDEHARSGMPGVVVFVKSPDGMWNGAAGYARLEARERMTPAHVFPSGSVGKMYTAVATMLLVDDGSIGLDDRINQYLPSRITDRIGNGNVATVRQLLNHTSGIRDFGDYTNVWLRLFDNLTGTVTPEEFLAFTYDDPPYFPAGTGYTYSNTNYILLALIMDQVLGESHALHISRRIIGHLGLTQTYYKGEPGYPNPPGLVNSYLELYGNGQLQNYTDAQINLTRIFVGHSAFVASSYDYAQFLEALLAGNLVSQAALAEMMEEVPGTGYGLGLEFPQTRYGRAVGHSGWHPGIETSVHYYPDHDTFLVILANGSDLAEERGEGVAGKLSGYWNALLVAVEDAVFK